MSAAPVLSPRESLLRHLQIERRSYILGTLLVLGVIVAAIWALQFMMTPELFRLPAATSLGEVMSRMERSQAAMTGQQKFVITLVQLVGSFALLFLNARFSYVIQRPRTAYAAPGQFSAVRLGWWMVLCLNSMIYLTQIPITFVLAYWGKQEIARRTALPPPAPPEENHD